MAKSTERFLKPKLLAQLSTMEFRVRTVVEGMLNGLHRSPYRGHSCEFAEYREYQLGDEPARIDWRVFARSDKYVIKEFEEETNLDAHIILDASASMGFGTGAFTKWQYAGILAASVAYILQDQDDAIGLVILDETIRVELQSKSTRGHLIHAIGAMEHTKPQRETRLAEVLHQVAAKIKRRGIVVVVSDLLDEPDEVLSALEHLQHRGSEVHVFQTLDEAELRFGFDGPHLFVDPETNQQTLAVPEAVRGNYMKALQGFLDHYSNELGKRNIWYSLVDTSAPLDEPLLSFFMKN
jgi:uncharacterized protein (DUF58 family)